MTTSHFSPNLLHSLRNKIPIAYLIEKELKVPCETKQGTFRFSCPLCKGSDTRINSQHNLARCFTCQKNFNPIDIVIAVKRIKFVPAVNLLVKIINNIQSIDTHPRNDQNHPKKYSTNKNRISENELIPISEIIPSIIERAKSKQDSNETCCDGCLSLGRRLESAEKELRQVKLHLTKLQMLIEQNL